MIERIHANPDVLDAIRSSLAAVHDECVRRWDALLARARDDLD